MGTTMMAPQRGQMILTPFSIGQLRRNGSFGMVHPSSHYMICEAEGGGNANI
jgi:hypothetical protein